MDAVDRLDRQLVHALGVNGRASFRELAQVLGAGERTLARRYAALRRTGVARVVALPTPVAHDLGQILRLRVKPGSAHRIARALARRDDVAWIRLVDAGAEVVCVIRAATAAHRNRLVLEQLPDTGHIVAVTSHAMLHHFVTPGRADWGGFGDPLTEEQYTALLPRWAGEPRSPHPRDADLIRALATDGRRPASELAAATGMPEATVRRRVTALLAQQALRLDLDLDPAAFGFPVTADLHVDVTPPRLRDVGAAMTRHAQTTFVAAVTGPCNVFAAVACRSLDELYRYTSDVLGSTDGIRQVSTSLTVARIKNARTLHVDRSAGG